MRTRKRLLAVCLTLVVGGAGATSACNGSGSPGGGSPDAAAPPRACVPGQQVACACPASGETGAQVCASDGQGFGACAGCGSSDGDLDGALASDTGAGLEPDAGAGVADASGDAGGSNDAGADGGASDGGSCLPGLQCGVACDGATTTVTGTVYDPAGKNPVYNVAVYVPAAALAPLPKGVPTGADACSCAALFTSGALTSTTTDANGRFTLTNVPAGSDVPLVLQIGKWRRKVTIPVVQCAVNTPNDRSLTLPGTVAPGDTDDNMPDIAVSTGGGDSLECLLIRMGVSASEYVAGGATSGHVHIFNGGGAQGEEVNPMAGAPASSAALWDTPADLMQNDAVLLSCEGEETVGAVPANLESYLNAGGRALASHFHYAWFAGSTTGAYAAPADWGPNLATWVPGTATDTEVGGIIQTTLEGTTSSFSKGVALETWLSGSSALSDSGAGAGELPIEAPRYNASVTTQKPSQPWIVADTTTNPNAASAPTLQFSFDTPVNTSGGSAQYCGRAVFSDLHVTGASFDGVNCSAKAGAGDTGCATGHAAAAPPPTGCDTTHGLSPQEKALEFALFDLSSCVIADSVPVTADAGLPGSP